MNSLDARPSKPRVGGSTPSRRANTPRSVERGSANAGGGLGLCGATFLVLLALKLTGHIALSWWWVTAPLWGAPALILGGFGLFALFCLVMALVTGQLGGKR